MDFGLSRVMQILLLEDDTLFGESLSEYLSECGYKVDLVKSVETALSATFEKSYDLYVLDINLPDGDGKEFLKELRAANDTTPALFLTSYKDKQTLLEGFQCGCDDYLKKPVDLDELEMRIEALLKRCHKSVEQVVFSNGVSFDMQGCRIYKNGEDLKFTTKALALLKLFIRHDKQVISKDTIAQELWSDEEFSDGSLRVYINRLKKILPHDSIHNVKGIGYRFELK
jgi:DNA-binding response OmpR family regulator